LANANASERGACSTDAGRSWQPFTGEPAGLTQTGMVAVSADARTIVWVPRAVVAHYSGDRGATWTAGAGLPVNAVVVDDRVDPGAFYVFDPAIGTPYISPNGGATFTATASGLNRRGEAGDCAGSPRPLLVGGGCRRVVPLGRPRAGVLARDNDPAGVRDRLRQGRAAASGDGRLHLRARCRAAGIIRSADSGASWVRVNDDRHQYASTGEAITGDPSVTGGLRVDQRLWHPLRGAGM